LDLKGMIQGGEVVVANAIQSLVQTHIQFNQLSSDGRLRRLSIEHDFRAFDGEELKQHKKASHFEPEAIDPFVRRLEDKSLLILAGEPGLGKTTIALLVSALLWGRPRKPLEKVLLCRNLDSNLRIDFSEITGGHVDYQNKIVIFKHGFSSRNEDVSSNLTVDRIEAWSERLRKNNSFLIVTEDQAEIPNSRDRLKGLGFLQELKEPQAEHLLEGLGELAERVVTQWSEPATSPSRERLAELIQRQGALIVAELRGMARISCFVSEYLPQVLREEISLGECLVRVKDLGPWLLQELPVHPEAWSTVVALTLCSASRSQESVPWSQFEALRRAISRLASRERGQTRHRRSLQEICNGDDVLRKAKAKTERGLAQADRIHFLDRRYPDQLWDILLGTGRDVTAMVLPLLRTLALGKDAYMGQAAARALGRIGRIDPLYITYPLLQEWSFLDGSGRDHRGILNRGTLVGHLFHGILSSRGDDEYPQKCLEFLRWLIEGDSVESLQIAVIGLCHVGNYDRLNLKFAMDSLRSIAEARLEPQWEVLRQLADRMRKNEEILRLFEEIFEVRGKVEEIPQRAAILFGKLIVAREAIPILRSVEYTLTGLLLSIREPAAILGPLLEWLQEDTEKLGPMLAYLFLKPEGIASWLERAVPGLGFKGRQSSEGNALLEAVCEDLEASNLLSRFLEQIYLQLSAFPGLLRVLLEESYVSLLANWSLAGKSIPRLRPTVIEILARLFESRDEEMSSRVLRLAQEHPASPDHADLRQLAIEAVTRPLTVERR
jgi:hypothetical protein